MADINDNDALAIADDYRGGGGFFRLRNRRFRVGLYLAAWGAAGIILVSIPGRHAVNPDHVMLCFVGLMAGVLLLLLSTADLPWADRAAGRLEGVLGSML